MNFDGFPETALDFYDDLEADNSKVFWEAHKQIYADAVRAPMAALVAELEPEFGDGKIFRPYRDLRFSKDKTPYKTHQGAVIHAGPATGWYVQIGAPGVEVGGGFYRASSAGLAAVRTAIDGPAGVELETTLETLRRRGWQITGDRLKTTPRGFSADHPRIELLRHRSLAARKSYGFAPIIHSADLVKQVRRDWRAVRPLIEWCAARLEGTADERR